MCPKCLEKRPDKVQVIGGGVESFLGFLRNQASGLS